MLPATWMQRFHFYYWCSVSLVLEILFWIYLCMFSFDHENGVEIANLSFFIRDFLWQEEMSSWWFYVQIWKMHTCHRWAHPCLPLTWQFFSVNWSVKTCPEVLKIGWFINGVTLACIWGNLFKFWTLAFLIWKADIIHTS